MDLQSGHKARLKVVEALLLENDITGSPSMMVSKTPTLVFLHVISVIVYLQNFHSIIHIRT